MTQPHDTHPPSPDAEVVFYNATPPDDAPLEVRLERDTLWLTQKRMARLFRTSASNVSRQAFQSGEIEVVGEVADESAQQVGDGAPVGEDPLAGRIVLRTVRGFWCRGHPGGVSRLAKGRRTGLGRSGPRFLVAEEKDAIG